MHSNERVGVCVYRTYELLVNGGTPYEKDVAVEASVTRECMNTQQPATKTKCFLKKKNYLHTVFSAL